MNSEGVFSGRLLMKQYDSSLKNFEIYVFLNNFEEILQFSIIINAVK